MAKKEETAKIVLERTYHVPLRRFWLFTPKYRRAKRAVNALKEFIVKHMKSNEVRIGKYANQEIWKRGIKSPPHHIHVEAKKDDKGIVHVELVGAPKDQPKKEKKKSEQKKETAKKQETEHKHEEHMHDHSEHEAHDHIHEHTLQEKHERKEEAKEIPSKKKVNDKLK